MGRKYIFVFGILLFGVFLCSIIWILTNSIGMLFLLNLLGSAFIGLFYICNILLRKSIWYKNLFVDYDHKKYPDNVWYREHNERNFDIVNLGSSGAKSAFDYKNTGILGMNWAQAPQTLHDDFRLLKNFHSILRQEGYVLITLMPFTSLNKKTGLMDTLKYTMTLAPTLLDPQFKKNAFVIRKYPILLGKPAIKALLNCLLKRRHSALVCEGIDYNPMDIKSLEADALLWVNGWKQQFDIDDFEAPLTPENLKGRACRVELMRDMIDFCRERNYQPVCIILPVTKQMAKYFSKEFKRTYIYSFIEEINRGVPVLDYSDIDYLMQNEFYFNSFLLNQTGRKEFTKRVLSDLKLISSIE